MYADQAQTPTSAIILLNFSLKGGTDSNVLEGNVLIYCKKKNKFQLKSGTSRIRFHSC